MRIKFNSHEEIDAYYKNQLAEVPKVYGGYLAASIIENDIFKAWRFKKEFFDRHGYAHNKDAQIVNISPMIKSPT